MRILHTVESYLPARHGMAEFVRQVSENLASKGHDVIVATSADSHRTEAEIAGVRVRGFDVGGKSATGVWGDAHAYQKFVRDLRPDVITNFAAQQWATDLIFPLLPELEAKKVLVPNGFSALGDKHFRTYFEEMPDIMKMYDACVFCSDDYRDIQFARQSGVDRVAFIPVGASAKEFEVTRDTKFRERIGIPESDFLVLHLAGYLSQSKGQLEAVDIFSRAGICNSTLLLGSPAFAQPFGNSFKPREIANGIYNFLRGRGLRGFSFEMRLRLAIRQYFKANLRRKCRIITSSLTQEEKVQAFLNADLLLFPSWIECSPLVLYEAMAAGTPFLVTDVGNAREIIHWSGGGMILPGTRLPDRQGSMVADVPAGARILDEVWGNAEARMRMGSSARSAWMRHFTWECISDRYEELYLMLLDGVDVRGRFKPPPAAQTE